MIPVHILLAVRKPILATDRGEATLPVYSSIENAERAQALYGRKAPVSVDCIVSLDRMREVIDNATRQKAKWVSWDLLPMKPGEPSPPLAKRELLSDFAARMIDPPTDAN